MAGGGSPRASRGSLQAGWGGPCVGSVATVGPFPPLGARLLEQLIYLWPRGRGQLLVCEELDGHAASRPKGPYSAFLATGWENKGLLLPSAEKPLIRGRGTWLQPSAPLSRGQPRSAAQIWEVVGCAPVLIWEALGGI